MFESFVVWVSILIVALGVTAMISANSFSYLVLILALFTVLALVITICRLAVRMISDRMSRRSSRSSWHWLP
jgi:hypothetical protein